MGKFSRQQIDNIFLIFSQKTGFNITLVDDLHGMSNPILWETICLHEMSNLFSGKKKIRKIFQNVVC